MAPLATASLDIAAKRDLRKGTLRYRRINREPKRGNLVIGEKQVLTIMSKLVYSKLNLGAEAISRC